MALKEYTSFSLDVLKKYHGKMRDWVKSVLPTKTSELENDSGFITAEEVPTKTSELENDSNFVKVVVSTEPPAEGTPDDVLTAILDEEPTTVVTSQDVLHIARVSELPEEPDQNTLYIVVEEA